MDRHELAWAAGFFDGEGWANAVRSGERKTSQPQARINQADPRWLPATLVRFRAALDGVGRVGGPNRAPGRIDMYWWYASSRPDVERLRDLLAPWIGHVKRAQIEKALGAISNGSRPESRQNESAAWAAGLFDGEGCCALLHHRTHEGYLTPELSVTQSSRVASPEVLERFKLAVGAGTISGPYTQRNATMAVYRWKAAARADVEHVIATLWPYLSPIKRQQAQRVLDALAAQALLPRGNPAFGYHKTHCVHGHEYAVARIRPFVARAGGDAPRENQKCLACLREYAREQREKKRSAVDDDRRSMSEALFAYVTS